MKVISVQPTITAGAYSAGDAVGGVMTFTCPGSNTVLLKDLYLLDDDSSPDEADLDLYIFTDSDIAVADNAAFTISQAEFLAGSFIGRVNFSTYIATPIGGEANATICEKIDQNILIPVSNGKFYGQLIANGTPTFNAIDQLVLSALIAEYA